MGFVAVCFGIRESPDRPEGVPLYGLVPVEHGRASLVGAICGEDPAALAMSLERRYVLAWRAARTAADLEAVLGGAANEWLRRTIDLTDLLARVADRSDGSVIAGSEGLSAAAAAFDVPLPPDGGVLDAATTIAVLFLVAATKLKALGFEDTRSLVRGRIGPR